jgi:hypothetical protein
MTATKTNGEVRVESVKRFDRDTLDDAPEALDVTDLGEGLRMVSRSTKELDQDFATEILNLPEFSSDRPLDNGHVVRLLNAMKRGTFLPEQVQIVTCTNGGKEYRMNGQHTCWARLEMETKYRCPIQHLRYTAKTENDMRRLYASIDRMKSRSMGNVVCSYLFDTEEWKAFSKRTLMKLAEALAFWLWQGDHERGMHDGDDRAYLLTTEYFKLGQSVATFVEQSKGTGSNHVRRRPVIAAMLATFARSAPASLEFWSAVRDGTGFGNKNDSRLVLRNMLVTSSISIGKGATIDKKSVSSEEVYRWCVYAWNAFRRGDATKQIKAPLNCDRPKAA